MKYLFVCVWYAHNTILNGYEVNLYDDRKDHVVKGWVWKRIRIVVVNTIAATVIVKYVH